MDLRGSQSSRSGLQSSTSFESYDDDTDEESKFISNLNRSFSKQKKFYKDRYTAKVKECDQLREDRDFYKQKLEACREPVADRLVEIARSNPYYVSGLQIGENNTMTVVTPTASDEVQEELETLISKLTRTIDNVLEDKTKVELELGQHKEMLRELHGTLSKYGKKYDENTKDDKKRFKKDEKCLKELKSMLKNMQADRPDQQEMLREIQGTLSSYCKKHDEKNKKDKKRFKALASMLQNIQAERPDEEVFSYCIEGINEYIHANNGIVSDFQSLPKRLRPGITRLVNKFGTLPWQTFASVLDVNPGIISALTEELGHVETPLQEDMFTKVLAAWVKESKRSVNMFLARLPQLELERTEEAKRELIFSINPLATRNVVTVRL